jgi:hypothetical protein
MSESNNKVAENKELVVANQAVQAAQGLSNVNVEYIKGETNTFYDYKQTFRIESVNFIINPPQIVDIPAAATTTTTTTTKTTNDVVKK